MKRVVFLITFLLCTNTTSARRVNVKPQTIPIKEVFKTVDSETISWVGFYRMPQQHQETLQRLKEIIAEEGFEDILSFMEEDRTLIVRSNNAYNSENPEILNTAEHEKWIILPQQLSKHGRDIGVVFATRADRGKIKTITMVLKGAGRISPSPDFAMDTELPPEGVIKPFFVDTRNISPVRRALMLPNPQGFTGKARELMEEIYSNKDHSFTVHSLIGVNILEDAISEFQKSLVIHGLLFEIDGNRADIPIYDRVDLITSIPVTVKGEEKTLSVGEYFSSSDILSREELMSLAYELKRRIGEEEYEHIDDYEHDINITNRYIDILWSDNYRTEIASEEDLMAKVRELLEDHFQIATLRKWESSNMRLDYEDIFNLSGENFLSYLDITYGTNLSHHVTLPNSETKDDYLRKDLISIMKKIAFKIGRTLGAVHGAGGDFHDSKDYVSSVEAKDISISGDMQDLTDTSYLPFSQAAEEDLYPEVNLKAAQKYDISSILRVISYFTGALGSISALNIPKSLFTEMQTLGKEVFNETYALYYDCGQEYIARNKVGEGEIIEDVIARGEKDIRLIEKLLNGLGIHTAGKE